MIEKSATLAYIIGVALGDGNLSCPNGRATRLRVTCDNKYPNVIKEIRNALVEIFPSNRVAIVTNRKGTCIDISVYSNKLNFIMPWQVGMGTKIIQQTHVPNWILNNSEFSKACLKGLIQTDGSIYYDRGYIMINFTNLIKPLIDDVYTMIEELKFKPKLYQSTQSNGNIKYVVCLSKSVPEFITQINLTKK